MIDFVTFVPTSQNLLAATAELILREQQSVLPDLSETVVLLPQQPAASQLRRQLLENTDAGLLLPRIETLRMFMDRLVPVDANTIPHEQRLLILVNALRKHSSLYGAGNPWLLAADLLKLFDELTLYRVQLPSTTAEFADTLARCYRLQAEHPPLLREARIVHTLWQAWHEQLEAEGWQDASEQYVRQLSQSLQQLPQQLHIYLIGHYRFSPAEIDWLQHAAQLRPLRILVSGDADASGLTPRAGFLHGTGTAQQPYSAFLQTALDHEASPLQDRARNFAGTYAHSPALDRIHIQAADSLEHEIRIIGQIVRNRLQHGDRNIGIITEDRKLARRLRAYLEHSGIELHDSIGWALTTTRSAALLESWLQCIEGDFPHHAFLDLLKSTALLRREPEDFLKLIYRFETDLVLHENIASGISRYRNALQHRAARLPYWDQPVRQRLQALLEQYAAAAQRLQKLLTRPAPAGHIAHAVLTSLQDLGLQHCLAADAAGEQILTVLDRMQRIGQAVDATIEWTDFRIWLGHMLETQYFSPPTSSRRVQLLTLQQSMLYSCDTLIIAGADEQHLPRRAGVLPFFNDAVRNALGLPDWRDRLLEQQYLFRLLLESSPRIFATWQRERNGESVNLSHWLEIIDHFHLAAYGVTLQQSQPPGQEIKEIATDVAGDALPFIPSCPAPAVPANMMPTEITVSGHQRLLNCAYQFYVHDVLQLKPLDEIREALQKSDYGSRVHLCLQAFHCGVDGLPGPFTETLKPENRQQAIAALEQIAHAVFTRDIEDNFQHRAWLSRWLARIADYIDWQTKHNIEWTVAAAEQERQIALDETFTLRGRIDRLEHSGERVGVIDYKTGRVPSQAEVLSGEDVQLVSYSLLVGNVDRAQYLGLDQTRGIQAGVYIEDETLQDLSAQTRQRLHDSLHRLRAGAGMAALGIAPACEHCDAAGLCRHKVWRRNRNAD
jgi:ATP-dependent helicase/nuclease subunit B